MSQNENSRAFVPLCERRAVFESFWVLRKYARPEARSASANDSSTSWSDQGVIRSEASFIRARVWRFSAGSSVIHRKVVRGSGS